MAKRLLAVIDETGTTNRPDSAEASDFAIAALLLPETLLSQASRYGEQIAQAVSNSDFKFKHVRKNSDARRLFLRAMDLMPREKGAYGFYTAGGAMLNERHRAYGAVQRHGTDSDGQTKAQLDKMLANPAGEMLLSFFNYAAPHLAQFAKKMDATIDVYMDRRSDLDEITAICEDAKLFPELMGISGSGTRVFFRGQALPQHQWLVRLTGTLAGDVRFFFQKHGSKIFSKLKPTHDLSLRDFRGDPFDPDEFSRAMRVGTFHEPVGDADYQEASTDSCMIRGYYKRFLSKLLSFGTSDGRLAHIQFEQPALWNVLQLPD